MATNADWNRWAEAQAQHLDDEALGIDSLVDTVLDPGPCSWDDAEVREVARWEAREGA